ncbi:MAG: sulfurtransferase [Lachnospiraceae bacterium]
MKKRIISLLLCLVMAAAVLVGCSSKEEPEEENQAETAESEESEEPEDKTAVEAEAVDTKQVYVTPEWVQSVIDGNQEESSDYVVLECSWGTEEDAPAYGEAHVPGAVHMNTDNIEEEQNWNIRSGEELEQLAKDFGITKDTTVICYSDAVTNSADDRVAFAFLWAGVENVKCIDGGFEAWTKAGYETESGISEAKATDQEFGIEVPAHPEYILTADEVKDKLANDDNFKLVSIRSEAEFLGETSGYSYIEKAGEPKGAIWGKDTDDGSYANEDGTIAGIDVLGGYLEESGATLDNELSFYCGTGWRATIPFLIMYQNGYTNMSLYDGGWFVWIMDDANEVQVGNPASDDCVYTTVGELSNDKAPQ